MNPNISCQINMIYILVCIHFNMDLMVKPLIKHVKSNLMFVHSWTNMIPLSQLQPTPLKKVFDISIVSCQYIDGVQLFTKIMSHKNIVVGYIKHKGDKMGQLFAKIMSHKNIFVEYLKVIRWYNYLLESVTCLVGYLKVKRLSNFKEKVQKIVFFFK